MFCLTRTQLALWCRSVLAGLRFSIAPWRPLVFKPVGLALLLGLSLLIWPTLAQAATWYPVAEATQGQQQQFVDIDSIQPLGLGQVRVGSYYIDRRSGSAQRTTYVTEYDCRRRQFRDVQYDGPVGSSTWQPVDPDPLNAAAMEYVCGFLQSNS